MSPMSLFPALFLIGMFIGSKSKKAGAVYDLIWSAGILIYALSVISSGGQLMLWNIELPNVVIVLIVLVIMVSEVFSAIFAFKEPSEEEKITTACSVSPAPGEEAIDGNRSATIKLVRGSKFVCSNAVYQVRLNGNLIGCINNGQTLNLPTYQKHNVLSLSCSLKQRHEVEFDAEPGGVYVVNMDVEFSDFSLALAAC